MVNFAIKDDFIATLKSARDLAIRHVLPCGAVPLVEHTGRSEREESAGVRCYPPPCGAVPVVEPTGRSEREISQGKHARRFRF